MNHDLEFHRRVSQIPFLGIGLSVDVYTPDLRDLMAALDHDGLRCEYLEIFKASHQALKKIRTQFPSMVLNYHAEGLWVSQPDWESAYPVEEELETTADHLRVLGSHWINQECASKQMVGYSFGTYLPPLFTKASATLTASNAASMQAKLDAGMGNAAGRLPLLLLETPPLTFVGFGDLSYPEYFRCLTESCACGVVLDIGHVWTVFRYSGAWRHSSLQEYLDTFLETFPLERVVQIHLAGLGHQSTLSTEKSLHPTDSQNLNDHPYWIDSHSAPIPVELWEMLAQVLKRGELVNLKGIALEVDTKPIVTIVEEFRKFQQQFAWWVNARQTRQPNSVEPRPGTLVSSKTGMRATSRLVQMLTQEYAQYVDAVTGRVHSRQKSLDEDTVESENQLKKYVLEYLPHEIMVWGGNLRDMFPNTILKLEEKEIDLSTFVTNWFSYPRPVKEPYDFFLLKINHFLEFVMQSCPELGQLASQEANVLREGYMLANTNL